MVPRICCAGAGRSAIGADPRCQRAAAAPAGDARQCCRGAAGRSFERRRLAGVLQESIDTHPLSVATDDVMCVRLNCTSTLPQGFSYRELRGSTKHVLQETSILWQSTCCAQKCAPRVQLLLELAFFKESLEGFLQPPVTSMFATAEDVLAARFQKGGLPGGPAGPCRRLSFALL